MNQTTIATAIVASTVLFGCGSSSGGDGIQIGNGQGGSSITVGSGGAGVGLGSGGSDGSSGNGNQVFDGGQVPVTKAQVDSIKGQACAGPSVEGETLPAVLQLVVDVSSSMNQRPQGSNRTKWEITRDALISAIPGPANATGGLSPSLAVGLLFYPNRAVTVSTTMQGTDACVNTSALIPAAALGDANGAQRTAIRNAFQQVQLQSSTPTHDAYKYAFENSVQTTNLPGRRFMLLITDGSPTLSLGCMNPSGMLSDVDPEPIVGEVMRTAAAQVTSFFIGSPGSEMNRNWLSRAAQIGGTATPNCSPDGPNYCHLDMTTASDFGAALKAGLDAIVGVVTPCTYTVPTPTSGTIDPKKINVILTSGGNSTLIVRDDVGECTQGWQLTPDNEIMLCKDTCDQARSAGMVVDVLFGCESLQNPPK
ncbi:MAG: vWA domain-containing protein [Myxococcota bacterium]